MEIARAILIKGSEIYLGEGRNKPFRASVRIGDDRPFSAIIKKLQLSQVIAECYAAILLRAWGLPVPTPLIVVEENEIYFGSTEEYPSLKQRLQFSENMPDEMKQGLIKLACEIVSAFEETPRAIVADEAIDNRDRNIANILWDGIKPTFIDHEGAFGLQEDEDANKLAQMTILANQHSEISVKAVAASLTWGLPSFNELSVYTKNDAIKLAEYVAIRINSLASRVLKRFPQPTDLLSEIT